MNQAESNDLATAVEALNNGDIELLVGLMSDEMVWRGASLGLMWWRPR